MNTLVLLSLEAVSLNKCCAISQVLSGQSPVRSWILLTSVFSSPQLWFISFSSLRLHTTNFLFVTYPHDCPAASVLAHPCLLPPLRELPKVQIWCHAPTSKKTNQKKIWLHFPSTASQTFPQIGHQCASFPQIVRNRNLN